MSTPAEVVAAQFSNAQTLADSTLSLMESAVETLNNSLVMAPTVDLEWSPVEAAEVIDAPDSFDADGAIANAMPTPLSLDEPELTLDEFTAVAPTIDEPDAPTVTIGDAPSAPSLDVIATPDVPEIDEAVAPEFLEVSAPTLDEVDLHEDLIANLDTIPTLSIVAPTAYTYTPGSAYSSSLLTALQTALAAQVAGGSTAAEDAAWDRAREREVATAQANMSDVSRTSESLGWNLPSDVLAARAVETQREYYNKVSTLTRERVILKEEKLQKTLDQVMQLESKLLDESLAIEQRRFESAKYLAQNAVEIHNARVQYFNALNDAYRAYASGVDAAIKGERLKIDKLQALVELEKAKASINESLVRRYESDVRARLARVELYQAQVQGAKLLVEIEGLKIQRYGEEVRAYVAGINGQTAKVELFKAQWAGEGTKADVFRTQAQAFQAITAGREAQSRTALGWIDAKYKAKTQEYEAWKTRMAGEGERVRAETGLFSARVQQNNERWRTQVQEYSAQQTYIINGQKLNADIIRQNNDAVLEAGKVGAQTFAQLTASAWSIIRTSASVSGSSGLSVTYSYSNKTNAQVDPTTSV